MTTDERARVRAWLESVRQNPAFTAEGAPFSLGPGINPHRGGQHLNSNRALVEHVLALVNSKPRDAKAMHRLSLEARWKAGAKNAKQMFEAMGGARQIGVGGSAQPVVSTGIGPFPLPAAVISDPKDEERAELDYIESLQALFLPLLTAVISDRRRAAERFRPMAEAIMATQVWCVPALRQPGGELYPHVIIDDKRGLWAYTATLLLDHGQQLDLRRCENCAKLFLVRPTAGRGRPQKRSCGPTCLRQAHKLDAPARQRRARARKLLERKSYGYGRERIWDAVEQAQKDHPDAAVRELAENARALLRSVRRQK